MLSYQPSLLCKTAIHAGAQSTAKSNDAFDLETAIGELPLSILLHTQMQRTPEKPEFATTFHYRYATDLAKPEYIRATHSGLLAPTRKAEPSKAKTKQSQGARLRNAGVFDFLNIATNRTVTSCWPNMSNCKILTEDSAAWKSQ